jgi:hypothetical protein
MWFITFVNQTPAGTSPADIRMSAYGQELVRRGVSPGQGSIAPFPGNYVVSATATIGGQSLQPFPVTLQGDQATLTASVIGDVVIELAMSDAQQPHVITCVNPSDSPMVFTVAIDQLPFQMSKTAAPSSQVEFDMIPDWTCDVTVGHEEVAPISFRSAHPVVTISESDGRFVATFHESEPSTEVY